MTVFTPRPSVPVDVDAIVARCPWASRSAGCVPLGGEKFLVRVKQGPIVHRHDHRRCVPAGVHRGYPIAWHPDDEAGTWHEEPPNFAAARWPVQRIWPAPWQVLASTIVASRTTPIQAQRALDSLYGRVRSPSGLADAPLEELLAPVGPRPAPFLRYLAEHWPEEMIVPPDPGVVAQWRGVGPMTVEVYGLFVFGECPPCARCGGSGSIFDDDCYACGCPVCGGSGWAWTSPLLALAASMRLVTAWAVGAPFRGYAPLL